MKSRRRMVKILQRVAALLAAATVIALLINWWMVARSAPKVFRTAAEVPNRLTLIVLGAGLRGNEPSDVLLDRLQTALQAFQSGRAKRILVSGDHGRPEYDEVGTMRRWLIDHGIPEQAIFMDHAGFRTFDTMARARQVFQVDNAVVITQEFHMARALYLAEQMGIDAVGLVADQRHYVYENDYAAREFLARSMSVLDVWTGRGPRFLGPVIPITGEPPAENP